MLTYSIWLLCDLSFHLDHHIIYICYFLCSFYFSFDIVPIALFWAPIRRHLVSLFNFPILSYIQVFSCETFACLSLKISIQLSFFPFLFSGYFCSVDACVVCIVFGRCNPSSWTFYLCVFVSMLRRDLQCWRVLFTPFLGANSLSPSSQRWKALYIVMNFLLFWSITLCSSLDTLKNGPEYLIMGTAIWWDFYFIVWLRVVFSFSRDIFRIFFFLYLILLTVSASNISKYLSVLILSLLGTSIPYVMCRLPFLNGEFFYAKIRSYVLTVYSYLWYEGFQFIFIFGKV